MSLLLDALKKAAEGKETNKPESETELVDNVSQDLAPEVNEELQLAEDTVKNNLPGEENLDLELAQEPEDVEIKTEAEQVQEIVVENEQADPAEKLTVDTVDSENISVEIQTDQSEQKLPAYSHADARKILEVSQKRYRNSQRMAYYGLYAFAALLFFAGSYLYYTAEILDNSERLVFKSKNKSVSLPKTEKEKKIEKQVSIAKAKLAEIESSENKNTVAKTVSNKKLIKAAKPKQKQKIQITRQKKEDPISVLLQKAYANYQASEYVKSDVLYQKVLLRDKRQRDALLGRAAIAVIKNEISVARNYYQQILRYYPRDSIATSALVDLARQEMTTANESQLNLLVRDNPKAAHVHFSLGLLYAKQNRIKESQQAFFDAFALEKKADYAYNLAVMLDKLGQEKAALSYYKQASNLSDKSISHFNEKLALERIIQLEGGDE